MFSLFFFLWIHGVEKRFKSFQEIMKIIAAAGSNGAIPYLRIARRVRDELFDWCKFYFNYFRIVRIHISRDHNNSR